MLKKYFYFNTIFNDAPQPWQIGFKIVQLLDLQE